MGMLFMRVVRYFGFPWPNRRRQSKILQAAMLAAVEGLLVHGS
jgi:hypothetical protein